MSRAPRSGGLVGAALALALAAAPPLDAQAGPRPGPVAQSARADTTHTAALERALTAAPKRGELYVELARAYLMGGRAADAERLLRGGATLAADPVPVRAALAELLAGAARWEDALAALAPVAALPEVRPLAARLRVNAGVAAWRRGDAAAARAAWEQALVEEPGLVDAAVNLVALLVETGEPAAARAVVDAALARTPGDARLLRVRTATLPASEALPGALTAARAARRADPRDEAVALELVALLPRDGTREGASAAAALLDTLLLPVRPSVAVFAAAGDFRMSVGSVDVARTQLERGVALHPRSATLHELLGDAASALEAWDVAARAYAEAAALGGSAAALAPRRVDALLGMGDRLGALAVARDPSLRDAPRDAVLRVAGALSPHGAEGADAAVALYDALLLAERNDGAALVARAALAESAGDTARALALYERAVALPEAGPDAALGLLRLADPPADSAQALRRGALRRGIAELQRVEGVGVALMGGGVDPRRAALARPVVARRDALGRIVGALLDTVVVMAPGGAEELRMLRERYPNSPLLDRTAARLAARAGRPAEAQAMFERLLEAAPTDASLHRELAALLERMGHLADARAAWTRALDLEPEHPAAFRALIALHTATGALDGLLTQVRRLRARAPSPALAEREIELLHRLGRGAEAEALVRAQAEALARAEEER